MVYFLGVVKYALNYWLTMYKYLIKQFFTPAGAFYPLLPFIAIVTAIGILFLTIRLIKSFVS